MPLRRFSPERRILICWFQIMTISITAKSTMLFLKQKHATTGAHTPADNPKIVSMKDIAEIAETFSDVRRAPIQFGHDTNAAAPRLGNVVSVYSDPDGKTLYADIEKTTPSPLPLIPATTPTFP